MNTFEEKLNMLQNGDIKQLIISKEEFLSFREVLVKREDFKHFSGNAMQGGQVVYTYLSTPRSWFVVNCRYILCLYTGNKR